MNTWSRVVLEELTGTQLDKKYPAFYRTRTFVTAFDTARHLSVTLNQISPVYATVSLLEEPF